MKAEKIISFTGHYNLSIWQANDKSILLKVYNYDISK